MRSRIAGLGRRSTIALLIAVSLALAGSVLAVGAGSAPRLRTSPAAQTDPGLYRAIVDRVARGENYYLAAADEQRKGGFPLRPFITFRLPILAVLSATVGPTVLRGLQLILAAAVLVAWGLRWQSGMSTARLVAALLLLAGGLFGLVQPVAGLFHESWAAMLLALAIALDRNNRTTGAIAAGTAALLVRELSLPLIVAFAALAWIDGRRRESRGWVIALALFAVALLLHAEAVSTVVLPNDARSPGWSGLLGAGFAIRSLAEAGVLLLLPIKVAAPLLTLSLAGLASVRGGWATRGLLMTGGYLLMVALFARADTFYWAMMAVPFSLVGLAFVPDALRDLFENLRRGEHAR